MKTESAFQLPIPPIYWMPAPNSTIDLGRHRFQEGDEAEAFESRVALSFAPRPEIEIAKTLQSWEGALSELRNGVYETSLALLDRNHSFEVFRTVSSECVKYAPRSSKVQSHSYCPEIAKAVFHLVNWPNFQGAASFGDYHATNTRRGYRTCGWLSFIIGAWRVTITGNYRTWDAVDSLKSQGGYVITHAGAIVRTDNGAFSTSQLDEVIAQLMYLLSFVMGRWTSPELCVGFGSNEYRVYESWGLGRCVPGYWSSGLSFFDEFHPEIIEGVIPGLWDLLNDNHWRQPMRDVIYWYLHANGSNSGLGIDARFMFSQVALELLSWTYLVTDKNVLSKGKFKKLTAREAINMLLQELCLTTEIPRTMTSLACEWEDSAHAITSIRNSLVHPEKEGQLSGDVYWEVLTLSLWLIEVVVLKMSGYTGSYSNRLVPRVAGQVSRVPWAGVAGASTNSL